MSIKKTDRGVKLRRSRNEDVFTTDSKSEHRSEPFEAAAEV